MAKPEKPKYLFSPIPPRAMSDHRLGSSHWRVLAAVSYYDRFGRNQTGCYARQSTIAEKTGAKRETVNRSLKDLVAWGYAKARRSPTGKRRVQYFIIRLL